MKFALINGERQEPQPKLTGHCPGCGEVVTAKCGTQRVWHWAHKGRLTCDPWWEPEGEWHRAWKNQFPISWQEIPLRSKETEELHIADIRTPGGLVIEFQHSAIDPAEQAAREAFYGNMIWVVDGTRLKRDRPRMDEAIPNWPGLPEGNVEATGWPEGTFPRRWISRAAPVLFDFGGSHETSSSDPLICLLPERYEGRAIFFPLHRPMLAKITEGEARIFDWREVHQKLMERHLLAVQQMRRRLRRRGLF